MEHVLGKSVTMIMLSMWDNFGDHLECFARNRKKMLLEDVLKHPLNSIMDVQWLLKQGLLLQRKLVWTDE